MAALAPALTPHGLLALKPTDETTAWEPARGARIEKAFALGAGHGLLCLGADEVGASLPPLLAYWREFGTRYVTALCALPDLGEALSKPAVPAPTEAELERLAAAVPPMRGAEYLDATRLPMSRHTSSTVRFWAERIQCLILAKACSIGLRSGA
jgi:hypothetical protein